LLFYSIFYLQLLFGHLLKISVIFQFLDDTLIAAPMGVKYGMEEWTVEISPPLVQRVAPAAQKASKWPSE